MTAPGDPRARARFLRVDGVPLHVRTEGSGPVCLLTGGLGGSWFDWDLVVPFLTPYRTVVRFDRPGHGLSAPEPATGQPAPTVAGEVERIRAVLDGLGLRGRCTVVGHSLGGFHAEAFARLHPDRAAGLVLVDSSVEPAARPYPAPGARDLAARALAGAATAVAVPYLFGPAARRLAARLSTVRREDLAPAPLVRHCYRTGRALRALLRENVRYLDMAAELDGLRRTLPLSDGLPITVLAADDGCRTRRTEDWLAGQRELAALLGADYRTTAPAGHLVMFDRPDAVASAVLDTR
ncbi:pimeloyl-ACP methyl ester carboxylesterase [Kitasatospora sp. MAA19]|uniref:alpha/beta fold hydrolase n=1 Tax=Kitasatospora sp. MAA19 TaxID=3035090 RepID=UPI0024763D32|nr:alpha/beta hydrolase [Kitasatospora sp. MAA19]MDH6707024.1 pimeloyl-ACP methyl ester carboxylesterase [Kitasatospora sp. MAA19]